MATGEEIRGPFVAENARTQNIDFKPDTGVLLDEIREMMDLFPNARYWRALRRWVRSSSFYYCRKLKEECRTSALSLIREIAENSDIRVFGIGPKSREFFRKVVDSKDFLDC